VVCTRHRNKRRIKKKNTTGVFIHTLLCMSSTLHFSLLRDPKLLDLIDEEWEKEVLPEDGECAACRGCNGM
jgi:hypothetical protein